MNLCGPGMIRGTKEVESSEMKFVSRMMTTQLVIYAFRYITGAVLVVNIQSIIMLSFCLLNIPSSYRSFCSTLMIEIFTTLFDICGKHMYVNL